MFSVSYHSAGSDGVRGMPPASSAARTRQWPKFGNVTIASRPTRSISASARSGRTRACSACVITT